jgi:hypothetical protein
MAGIFFPSVVSYLKSCVCSILPAFGLLPRRLFMFGICSLLILLEFVDVNGMEYNL